MRVARPTADEVAAIAAGTVLIGFLSPLTDPEGIERLRRQGVVAFAMESVPRITRAQSMDALSSQANVAGYKAVLIAADRVPKLFPLLMTAAGTIAPARVLVMGAGVAGLQAIATARRLGAVVSAFDVRPAVKEQVESLGARFLDLGVHGEETEGGYAKELTPEQQAQQQAALEERVPDFDVVITTALIPGRPAPQLIPASAVANMRPGSCIVDLAAEAGGNCELTQPGIETVREGVTIVGFTNLPSHDGLPREPALRAQRRRAAAAPRAGRRARARLRRRDHRRRLRGRQARGPRRRSPPPRLSRRHRRGGIGVNLSLVIELTILALAIFLGFEVISKVPAMLHTPLMSGTNFIHGIVIVGAIIVLGEADDTFLKVIGFVAMVLATANVVGGWFVTDRMLEMFKKRPEPKKESTRDVIAVISPGSNLIGLLYLVTIICFIFALRFLSSPEARAAGELDRRRRDDPRDRQHAAARRDRQLGADHHRRRDRRRGRPRRRPQGEDDRDAADGGPVQRGRRRRRGARRAGRVPHRDRRASRRPRRSRPCSRR